MKIITTMLEEELYESTNIHGNKVQVDMRPRQHKVGLSPVESLVSSIAACGAVDIVVMLRKRKKTVQAFTIETDATRREDHPRAVTHIHCKYCLASPDATEDEVGKIAKLALEKYCSVAASVKSDITYSVEIRRP